MNRSPATEAEDRIAAPLLEFLRSEWGECRYAEEPAALVPGHDTSVYAFRLSGVPPPLDGPLVLRLFRAGTEPVHVVSEAVLQNAIAGQGFPAAPAHAICERSDVLGAPFFLMERLPGGPLFGESVELRGDGTPGLRPAAIARTGLQMLIDLPRILAEVDARVHALDALQIIDAFQEARLPWRSRTPRGLLDKISGCIDDWSLDALRGALDWLVSHLPKESGDLFVCHGDMQPLNLLATDRRVCGVVDWSNTLFAPAECEIGWTRASFLTLPLPLPGPLALADRLVANGIANRYTKIYERERPLDTDAVRYYEAMHSLLVIATMERQVASGGIVRDGWNSARGRRNLTGHFRSISGLAISWSTE